MTEVKKPVDFLEITKFCANVAREKLAEDVVGLKVRELSSIADYFLICTATSQPHLKALASHLERQVREAFAVRPLAVDGEPASDWVLLDFGGLLIHLMTKEARERYNLERLWNDAPKMAEIAGV